MFAQTGTPVPNGTNGVLLKDWPVAYPKGQGQGRQPVLAIVNAIGGPSPDPAYLTMNVAQGGAYEWRSFWRGVGSSIVSMASWKLDYIL